MRHFVYFSEQGRTSGNFSLNNLMVAGRMDIAVHVVIAGLFLSHNIREDATIHLIFYGMPDPPKHIEITANPGLDISKKDVAGLIKKILYKYKEGKKLEVFPGCLIEKKSFLKVIEGFYNEDKKIFILDREGKDIRKAEIPEDCVFIIGDQKGLPKKETRRLKEIAEEISIGPKVYFASHVVAVINNELDRRAI